MEKQVSKTIEEQIGADSGGYLLGIPIGSFPPS